MKGLHGFQWRRMNGSSGHDTKHPGPEDPLFEIGIRAMKVLKWAVACGIALFLAILGLGLKTFYDAGEFKSLQSHFQGRCRVISGLWSSEDITVHPKTGMAFISSADRRARAMGLKHRQGAIHAFDLNAEKAKLVNLTASFNKELNPHGIGLWMGPDGATSLFVVNHGRLGHFVEIFDHRAGRLVHRESVQGDLMTSPNDVIPCGPRSFYVTNDHGTAAGFGRTIEEYLQLARSYVLYYDGRRFQKVAEGLAYANGIRMSRDGGTVYVTATVGKKLYLYDRHEKTGGLTLRRGIDLGTGPDNIELDEKGRVWIGAHPKLLTFAKYAKDPDVPSPSQVLRLEMDGSGHIRQTEVYLSKGKPLSASSVAAPFKGRLLIGSVFDPRFLLCTPLEMK
jgi:arylesterase/paraoxonase